MTIAIGTEAPDFELPSNLEEGGKPGKKIKLSDFRGKPVVLAFYPLDFSPTCTKENACFRNDFGAFSGIGAQVLGISVDSAWTHAAFAKQHELPFPLLADFHPKGAVAKQYGLYFEQAGITKRATVVIDGAGKVAWAQEHPIGEQRDNKELLEAVRAAG
jgi:peroxiredoxin